MPKRIKAISRQLNGIEVFQRESDGYINATQICKVHRELTDERKDPSEWLSNKDTKSKLENLSSVTGIPVTGLVDIKRGGKYQGTWIHPRIAVRFAMWVNDDFSQAVEDWVHGWSTFNNPAQLEADLDRVSMRDELKDSRRLALTEQVKLFLETAGKYDPSSKDTRIFFGRVHNEVNLVLTGEKAKDMRSRLEQYLGKKVSDKELLRDYFPITDLADYAAVCQAAANNMEEGMHPINAVRLAAHQVLPRDRVLKPIDFIEQIKLVRGRIAQAQDRGVLPE